MKLKSFLPQLDINVKFTDLLISNICDDSRIVEKNDIFFIIERKNFDIFSVLSELKSKVAVFVASSKNKSRIKQLIGNKPIIFVDNVEEEFFKAVNLFYGFSSKSMKIIGVTGTNGKTTVATLIYYLLKSIGEKVSLISTVKQCIGRKIYKAEHTTPDFLTLRKLLREASDQGCNFLVMEVSSHAIKQRRIKGLNFSHCVFTNLSRDHLDYHKSFNDYSKTKEKFLLDNKKAIAVVNVDDFYGKKIFQKAKRKLSYGIKNDADFKGRNIKLYRKDLEFNLFFNKSYKVHYVKTHLLGEFNVLNILGAVAVVKSLGFSFKNILKYIASFKGVSGRLQRVGNDVFVDYAHTPDALLNALLALRKSGYNNIVCVFGCGGNRDKGKRSLMGKIACEHAEFSFITSDNSRDEDPLMICQEVKRGFTNGNVLIELDRKKAIKKSFDLMINNSADYRAKKILIKTCLLIAGKGHESYQILKTKKIPFSDVGVVRGLIRNKRN